MGKVSSTEFVRTPGQFQDQAQREPVIIMKHNREHAVILSAEEYRRLKRRDRLVFRAGELSDEDIAAIRLVAAPASAATFDDEMDKR
jgi:prevent-host-death family protein